MDAKKPYLAVVLIQCLYSGMFLLSKAAFNGGMNSFVFVFYRQTISCFLLVPLAFTLEWKKRPPLSFTTFCKIFMLSLCGITLSLDICGIALVYTSATLGSATSNCLPAITFFLALLLGMEMVKIRTKSGAAKVTGIVLCLGGAVTLAFYKGPHFNPLFHNHANIGHLHASHQPNPASSTKTWIKGCFLMLLSNIFWAFWLVLQGGVMKVYPSKLLFTSLQCFLSSVQSFAIALAFERDMNQWKLGWNVGLIAIAYCGVVVTGVAYYLQTWVVEQRGPVFLAMSTPLSLIITMFFSSFLLGEITTLGSVLGGILLVGGLYAVLWGKSKEENMVQSSSQKVEAEKQVSDAKVVVVEIKASVDQPQL
ncbi:EamA domain [Dillenia turbinata]|uniref:WAT1-related protein n=1 Tax=Dillenia turbinata TaxID=194707 RepID=A0AAN8UXZ0_9MAGN